MSEKVSTFINPLTDFGFKYIFGRDADKEFTISFLNALGIAPRPIVDITFVDKENPGEAKDDRALIYDLHCVLEDKTKIIVEMQNRYQTHFNDRAIYYLAADLYSQGQKGPDWGYRLTPVYGVFVMNFEWKDVDEQHLREDVCLYNMQTKSVFSDKMRMTFLKIPMMDKEADECRTTLERWLYILKHMEKMEAIPHSFTKDPVFRNLNRVAKYAALSEPDKVAYRKSLKAYRDAYAIAETERNIGKEEGIKIGKEEGIQIGKEEGIQIGKEQGIQIGEAKERRNSIRTMLAFGISIEQIAEKYGISVEEISKVIDSE